MTIARHPLFTIAILALAGIIQAGFTASAEAENNKGIWSFVLENDLFYDTDQNYTNGVRLEYARPPGYAPDWFKNAAQWSGLFPEGQTVYQTSYALGQNIYTPTDIEVAPAPTNQRPYAGWLYGEGTLVAENGSRMHALKISLGVVGPASLAEETQKTVHDIVGAPEPLGWDDQLENELAILVGYQRSVRLVDTEISGLEFELIPHAGVSLGNVFTYASLGGSARIGHNLPRDYGATRIQPNISGSSYFQSDKTGFYFFTSIEGRAVGYNIFLDGNTFRNSASVDKKTYVGDAEVGLAIIGPQYRLAFTRIYRSDEYEGQPDGDQFGAISLSVGF